jgi:6-phosphogluconolactonase
VGPVQQVIEQIPKAHCIQVDEANRFAFVPSLGDEKVRQFKFDSASGKLSPNSPDAVRLEDGSGPRHFAFHPNGRLAYLLCEASATLIVFDYDPATGLLRQKQGLDCKVKDYTLNHDVWHAADLHLTPDGSLLYASERASSTLAALRIDPATGMAAFIAHFPTETLPRGFAIDPSGRYLLAAGQASHHLAVYAIDPAGGELTFLARYAAGKNPNWIEFVTLP